jgi:hypothetical protein
MGAPLGGKGLGTLASGGSMSPDWLTSESRCPG